MPGSDVDIGYRWKPIERIDAVGSSYDFSEIDSLQRQWLSIRKRREESNPQAYDAFLERLDRSWAIETGIIEGLYTLDRGVTETLVQRGFNSELIDRSATNKDPIELVSVLEDHRQAAKGVYGYIREGNPLTKFFIRQLHVILTEHLPTYTAYDQFGNRFETSLERGGFKTLPNNPTRPDGRIHEYCPPVQVDSEVDNLVEWHAALKANDCHPLLTAAWLHHAFTQIHPFQDGNGRVARALLTWHLVKEEYLSVVVSRDDRPAYIDALEAADYGDLDAFVDFLVRLERQTILHALAEPEPIPSSRKVGQAVENIAAQIQRRNRDEENQLRYVTEVGRVLYGKAVDYLEVQADYIREKLIESEIPVSYKISRIGPFPDEWTLGSWFAPQIVKSAQEAGHWANFNEQNFMVKLSIIPASHETKRNANLVFLISLHHTGRQLSGVMAGTAFAQIEFQPYGFMNERSEPSLGVDYRNCAANPFTFTWTDDANAIELRFFNWIEEALSEALRYWQEFLA